MNRDSTLINDFLNGNERAFDELVNTYSAKSFRLIYSFVYKHHDAQDLNQELWLLVYRNLKYFKHQAQFYTWLYRIAVNLCNRFLQKNKTRLSPEEFTANTTVFGTNPDEITQNNDTMRKIYSAVACLPEKQRAVFILRNYQNLSYEEISGIINISVGSAKTNHCYAVKTLQNLLPKDVIL
ncbi:MAG: hypothetical protein A2252_04115 [Elusimicrobia bacterium RIFOXYA2_FULL_39_19]|nr:MAG: hypothetical protein A2252_04115 [Elusimicrobia bacterium RIFOXYA2_FULL_39_19]